MEKREFEQRSGLPPDPNGSLVSEFQTIIFPYLVSAYSLARYLTKRHDLAEDLVQEALLRAFRSFSGFRGGDPKAWLLTIVRNCFLSQYNRLAKDNDPAPTGPGFVFAASAHAEGEGIERETPETLLIRRDESSALRLLIEQLPHSFREVLVLRDVEDLSYQDIAQALDVPVGTVMSRLARARKMLAAAWKGLDATPQKEKAR